MLLRVEKNSGHTGSDMIKATINRYADEYAFTRWQMEVKP